MFYLFNKNGNLPFSPKANENFRKCQTQLLYPVSVTSQERYIFFLTKIFSWKFHTDSLFCLFQCLFQCEQYLLFLLIKKSKKWSCDEKKSITFSKIFYPCLVILHILTTLIVDEVRDKTPIYDSAFTVSLVASS